MKEFILFLLVFLKGIGNAVFSFMQATRSLVGKIPFYERIFLAGALFQGLTLARPWRSFEIELTENVTKHGMMTDDFLWYAIAFTLAGLPTLVILTRHVPDVAETRFTFFFRVAGLSIISVFYFLSLFNSHRISPTDEATFTLWFVLFGLLLPVTWVSGVRSVIHYAQSS